MKENTGLTSMDWFWKVPLIGLSLFVGNLISGALVTAVGLEFGEYPGQVYNPAMSLLAALVLGAALFLLARGISGSTWLRSLVLFAFTYVSYCVNNQIEGATFTTVGGQGTMLVFSVLPSALTVTVAALLIKPPAQGMASATVFTTRPVSSWLWRAGLAWLAFPIIYYLFGGLAYPFVADSYEAGQLGLTVPSQGVIVTVVSVRSLLFLLVTIPILMNWAQSRSSLFVALAVGFSAMVGVSGLIEATWLPTTMRLVHSAEIIADSVVYTWVLLLLLIPKTPALGQEEAQPQAGV